MPPLMIAVLALHVLAGLFWLGSSLVLARTGQGSAAWFRPQMAAATIAVFAGGGLWSMAGLHGMGQTEQVLAAGGLAAIVAAGIQGALVGGPIRRLKSGLLAEGLARRKMALGQRIAAALLLFALAAMVIAGRG